MSLESALQFVMNHNAGLIESLIALILLSVLFLAFRAFRAPEETSAGGAGLGNLAQLEETLKKLLDKAAVVPAAGSTGAASGGASPELLGEIETLKNSLLEKQNEIEQLKVAGGAAGAAAANAGMSEDEKAKLEAQLKELKGKLDEYEIISEDIADLSFYKEENAKLVKQLEAVKGGAAALPPSTPAPAEPVAAPAPVAPPAPTPEAPPAPQPAPVAPVPEPQSAAPPPAEAAVAEAAPLGVDDDLMAEFARAVEEQTSGGAPASAPTAPQPPPPAAPPVAAAAEPEVTADSGTDLGAMDMDKMMVEAEGIGSAADAAEASVPNALEETLNADKLIAEASELTAVKAEDKNLMNDFENFVKKGS